MRVSRINSGIRFAMRLTLAFSLLYLGVLAGSAWRTSVPNPVAAQGPCPDQRCEDIDSCDEETYLNYRCDTSSPLCRSVGCSES